MFKQGLERLATDPNGLNKPLGSPLVRKKIALEKRTKEQLRTTIRLGLHKFKKGNLCATATYII